MRRVSASRQSGGQPQQDGVLRSRWPA